MAGAIVAAVVASSGFVTGAAGAVGFAVGGAAGSAVLGQLAYHAARLVITSAISSIVSGMLGRDDGASFTTEARDRAVVLRSSVANHRVIYGQAMVSGPLVFAASTGDTNEYLHLVIALAGHQVEEIGDVYFGDRLVGTLDGSGNVTDGDFAGKARIKKHLGSTTQTADSDLVSEVSDWTTAHRLQGISYLYVRLEYDADVYPTGIPNIKAVVKGKKLYDPRTATTAYSDNWALCIRDYLVSDYGLAADTAEIDDTLIIAAANICDESVSVPSGTQERYNCNGVINTGNKPVDIMTQILTAGAGALTYSQGVYKLFAGAYTSSTETMDEDWLRAPIKLRAKTPRKELYNGVRGTYVNPDNYWQASDFPIVKNTTYATEDGGQEILRDIELPFTTDAEAAQRIAKIHLEKSRQPIIVDFPANLQALSLSPWDTVSLTIDTLGWSAKEFKVVDWRLSVDGGVDLVLQEEASASYDWASGDATTVDPAPDTNLPSAFSVNAPGFVDLTEELYSNNGIAKSKALVSWVNNDVFAESFQLEYKLSTASEYTVNGTTRALSAEILDLVPGLYNVRIKAINSLGVSSPYTTIAHEYVGLLGTPDDVAGLTLSKVGGLAILRWTQHADLDVRVGGRIVFRHSQSQVGATWQGSTSIGEAVSGNESVAVLPLKPGTYLVKAVDSSGVYSATAATASTNGAQVLAFSNVDTVSAHPNFSGTHVNTVGTDSTLRLAGIDDVDDWLDVDSVSSWDIGDAGVTASGTYTFAAGIDLGAVERSRLRTLITSSVINVNHLIDSRLGSVDDWEDFDGTAAASADCQVWARETDDDPAGSPTWSAWERLDSAEYEARAFEFQARLSTNDIAYNINVTELTVNVDQ